MPGKYSKDDVATKYQPSTNTGDGSGLKPGMSGLCRAPRDFSMHSPRPKKAVEIFIEGMLRSKNSGQGRGVPAAITSMRKAYLSINYSRGSHRLTRTSEEEL